MMTVKVALRLGGSLVHHHFDLLNTSASLLGIVHWLYPHTVAVETLLILREIERENMFSIQ